jgi:hypothetical protein
VAHIAAHFLKYHPLRSVLIASRMLPLTLANPLKFIPLHFILCFSYSLEAERHVKIWDIKS